jgi:hypothetical protein
MNSAPPWDAENALRGIGDEGEVVSLRLKTLPELVGAMRPQACRHPSSPALILGDAVSRRVGRAPQKLREELLTKLLSWSATSAADGLYLAAEATSSNPTISSHGGKEVPPVPPDRRRS